ncbi:MAG: hypothetical protein HKN33_11820 [Pyrinomonadaceae bacterium]|nr:hypothetical protein [Pyrinomonadaceae bacterium]
MPNKNAAKIYMKGETYMGRFNKLITFFAFSAMMLGLAVVASAQYRDRGRYGNGNGGYYGNRNISSTVKSLRNSARRFEDTLDRELDRSRLDGSQREDYLNNLAKKFKNAAEDLDDEYEGYRSQRSASDEARRVLNTAAQLDNALRSSRIGRRNYTLRNSWTSIENQLRVIAREFNYRYNGTYGQNGGRNDRYNRNDRRNDRWGRNDRRNDRWGRNDRNNRNRNTRYGNISQTVSNLKYKAKSFEDRLDQDRYDNNYGSNLEGLSDRFKNAVDDLYDDLNDRDGGYDEARKVLNIGSQLDREISRTRVGRGVKNDWRSIERDLQTIARAYNLSYNGNNRRGIGLGDIFRNFPF